MIAMTDSGVKYIRDYVCHVEHFLIYVEDAMVSPEHVDFDVLKEKIEQIRKYATFMEKTMGIRRD